MKGPRANRKVKAQRHGRPSVRPARRRGPKKNQKAQGKKRLTEKRTREQQGGFLPKRPDIKGLDSDTGSKAARKKAERKFNKHAKKQVQAQNTDGDRENKDFKGAKGPQRPQERPRNGQLKDGALKGGRSGEEPRKRKLVNGQERLRAILDKFPHLLLPGETADAAVAACFKKAGNSNKAFETGPSECAENEAQGVSGDSQQRQQLSGSKRRKLLRLVINSKTAENKVFVHESYQLYNDILRSIRTAEGPGGASESSDSPGEPGAPRRNKDLKSLVKSAVNFLEGPLSRKDRHSCTARLAQICLKYAEGDTRKRLWDLLSKDFTVFCECKSFHHVCIKMYLYGTTEQKEKLAALLASRRDTAFTKHGAAVWEYIYTSQKTALGQQKLLNSLLLEPALLVAVPNVLQAASFAQVAGLLSEEQKATTLEKISTFIQKFVDKELLSKAYVHRILKGYCSVASAEQQSAIWKTVCEGALHLATTKDGVEEILPKSLDLAFDPYGHLLLLQLLQQDGVCRQLPTHYQALLSLPSPTSLKSLSQRLSELRPTITSALCAAFESIPVAATEGQRVVGDLLRDNCASKVLLLFSSLPEGETAALKAIDALGADLERETPELLNNPASQRAACGLIKSGSPAVLSRAWSTFESRLSSALETKGVFVVARILKTAAETKQTDMEAEVRGRLDEKTLSAAEASLAKSADASGFTSAFVSEFFFTNTD
ncbi:hypothetical protein, conserved [Eimeria tenella]|uniref:Uncharacterized protein n=1 Tax=Eimeria tenella TaxID=5802 RepID=U6KVV1_EIMTE|nr:hypothetical protein, conserved [Eimeria tenella]CDJ40464.1 hypothetical protein, conserved [Eimeria tenella]|eukprot:XP_013231214.1 hypothetical protein, conserved [Eimeria tenella]